MFNLNLNPEYNLPLHRYFSRKARATTTTASPSSPSSSPPPTRTRETMTGPLTVHPEHHAKHGKLLRDCIIGLSDGLTVPFALCAGLSSLGNTEIVILAGLAELFAGSISMGVGAVLAALTERAHYRVEEERERREVKETPAAEEAEIFEIFERYGVEAAEAKGVVEALKKNEDMWVQFMMDFELQLEKPATRMAAIEGAVMGLSYFIGGLLPMIPYFALHDVHTALFTSIGITAAILAVFGYAKAYFLGTSQTDAWLSAGQTLLLGTLAAGASYGIVRGVNGAETL